MVSLSVALAFGLGALIAALLWTLPGLALLSWLRRHDRDCWSVQRVWASAVALSGALLVVLPQLTILGNIPLGAWAVWLILLVSAAYVWRAHRRAGAALLGPLCAPDLTTIVYGAVAGLTIAARALAVSHVSAPLWGDSVHHAIITQLMIDRGGNVHDYAPYLPLHSFTYHAGFHLLSAWLAWCVAATHAAASTALIVLLNGQILNAWSAITVGLLAEGLVQRTGDSTHARWAGVVAVLIAGLLSPMPAYYVNWGRYTQLAGQVFLAPAVLWAALAWQSGRSGRDLVPVALAIAAVALSHYGVALMFGVALVPVAATLVWEGRRDWRRAVRRLAAGTALTGLVVALAIVRAYANLSEGPLVAMVGRLLTGPARPTFSPDYNAFGDITTHVPLVFLVLSAASFVWLAARCTSAAFVLGGWVAMLFVLSNPYTLLRLPGTGLVDNFAVQLGLYVPLSALCAIGLVDGAAWIARGTRVRTRAALTVATIAILALALNGAWRQAGVVDSERFAVLTPFDERAASWIARNTPADAVFHINGFFAYADSVVVGSDGGWWLWLLARRHTTVPPIVYAIESGPTPGYRGAVNERFRRLNAARDDPTSLAAVMRQEGIDYVYIGARRGRAGLPQGLSVLDPAVLQSSPAFDLAYTDDVVWVFRAR